VRPLGKAHGFTLEHRVEFRRVFWWSPPCRKEEPSVPQSRRLKLSNFVLSAVSLARLKDTQSPSSVCAQPFAEVRSP